MNFLGFTITKTIKPTTAVKPEVTKPTLVVTGCCSEKDLTNFEEHCQKKGQTVIATKLPVLGVFNMQDPNNIQIASDGTKSS